MGEHRLDGGDAGPTPAARAPAATSPATTSPAPPAPATTSPAPPAPDVSPPRLAELLGRDMIRLTVGTVLLLGCNAFEIIGAATGMPAVLDDVGGVSLYGAAVAAAVIASVFAAPLGGRLADRFGVVTPLVASLGLFVGGLVATAAASSMAWVAVGRFLTGLGGGSALSLQLVIVARFVPLRLRALMLAVVGTVFIVPGLIGPTVSAKLAATVGWRWIFGGVVPVIVGCAAILLPDLRRRTQVESGGSESFEERPWWGPPVLSAGLGVAVLAGQSQAVGWLVLAALGVVATVVGARATMPVGLWTARPGYPAAVACALAVCAAYLTSEAFLPLLLRELRHRSLFEAGLPLTVAAIVWTGAGWFQARLLPAQRPRWTRWGGVLAAIGLGGSAALVFPAVPAWIAYPATGLGAFGCGLVFTIAQTVAVESAAVGQEGAYTSTVQLSNLLGNALGTSLGAVVIAQLDGQLRVAVAVAMFATVVAAALAALIAPRIAGATVAP